MVGATAPEHLGRLRELMPDSIFLIPGVGAQGGKPEDLGPALAPGRPASVLVAAARSIAGADDRVRRGGASRSPLGPAASGEPGGRSRAVPSRPRMPDYKPNPIARLVAVFALVAALLLLVAVIATTGSDEGDAAETDASRAGPTSQERRRR